MKNQLKTEYQSPKMVVFSSWPIKIVCSSFRNQSVVEEEYEMD